MSPSPTAPAAPAPHAAPHAALRAGAVPAQRTVDVTGAPGAARAPRALPAHVPAHVPAQVLAQVLEPLLEPVLEDDHHRGTGTALLLVEVAGCPGAAAAELERRMRSAVRAGDRWSSPVAGVHAVLLTGLRRSGAEGVVERAAEALLHALECWPHTAPGTGARVSVGASLAPARATTAAEAVRQAGAALAAARRAGGGCARIGTA
ncbi:hypothetical protein [Kineococcus gypseus]|uniref:hypothetical protein n=1 Tax=Kineococcus gypseus TaxID=1637102 RepID=UPI003D7CACC1